MTMLLQHLLNGLSLGAIYALIALGYTLVYGVLRLINFAHGDIFMVAAFAGLFAATGLAPGLHGFFPFIYTLLAAMLAAGLLGLAIERLAYRPLRSQPRVNLLITAVGVSLLLENLAQVIWGADPRQFPAILDETSLIQDAAITVSNVDVIVLLTAFGLMAGLEWLIHRTRFGLSVRAASHDHATASLMGVPVDKVIGVTFFIGSALAAGGAVLYGVKYPKVDPLMGIMPGLKAFVAAVLGGIGNLRGAVLGSLILGLAETLIVASGYSTWRDALAFGVLIVILILKPAGLLGRYRPEKV